MEWRPDVWVEVAGAPVWALVVISLALLMLISALRVGARSEREMEKERLERMRYSALTLRKGSQPTTPAQFAEDMRVIACNPVREERRQLALALMGRVLTERGYMEGVRVFWEAIEG